MVLGLQVLTHPHTSKDWAEWIFIHDGLAIWVGQSG